METASDKMRFSRPSLETLLILLGGNWKTTEALPSAAEIAHHLNPETRIIRLDAKKINAWDTGFLYFLVELREICSKKALHFDSGDLPEGARRLLNLAAAMTAKKERRRYSVPENFLQIAGRQTLDFFNSSKETLDFLGEATLSFFDLLRGKTVMRRRDLLYHLQGAGAQALPIVSLINFPLGAILAFNGAIQLKLFGAEIYVADLVGIGMVRVMGAVMSGIIMAGRTGTAYAAQLGTMQVNEEIDALKTLGIDPMGFLVLPRLIALVSMMPLLCLYADFMGILGGLFVSMILLDIGPAAYLLQTREALSLLYVGIGLFHSFVFGILVALAGCLRGMQCGRSASAVGEATTSAAVTSIVGIILATGIITLMCNLLGI